MCCIFQEGHKSDVSLALSETLYRELSDLPNLDGEVVLDDRLSLSIGKRLYQARQLGYPLAIVAGKQASGPSLYPYFVYIIVNNNDN